jgi:hypothetical protein
MFPAVVIDLGTPVAPAEAASVVAACNAAIVAGSCSLEAAASEPAQAIAIVRWSGSEQRRVRIEVGLREADRPAWSVREVTFSPGDPVRERWRTVGLVIATLAGELDTAQDENENTRPEAATSSTPKQSAEATSPSGPQATDAEPAVQPAPPVVQRTRAPTRVEPSDAAAPSLGAQELARLPLARPETFVAAGVLAGEGADFDPMRWGGALRAGWISPPGWVFSLAADYSRFDLGSTLDAAWLRIAGGAGYHLWLAERWSGELSLELGARVLSVDPNPAGSIQSTAWSPQGALRGEAWFQALSSAGVWGGLTASSIGRETRLLGTDSQPEVVVPLIELHGMIGLWWAP